MKLFSTLFFSIIFSSLYAQEISKMDKIKIGKFDYEIFLKDAYFYEDDEYAMNYYIRLSEKNNL
jgi:hypothetical protein